MSNTGNRSHPNSIRTSGQPDSPVPAVGGVGPSSGGMHQESRDHHKHNNKGQTGHKPQRHSPGEEKR